MRTLIHRALAALLAGGVLAAGGLAGCNGFLEGEELGDRDPNRPTTATATQRFVGVQTNLTALLGSDPLRLASLFTQQLGATGAAYQALTSQYSVSESTTNGFFTGIYGGGGLIDVRAAQDTARAAGDSTLLGALQVQEALLIGTAADLFGDIIYTQAYSGPNPALDPQLAVYDSVQAVLSRAVTALGATGPTNFGPQGADLVYGGSRASWRRLAHTLKARFYLHTAEVRPTTAYALALAEARQGILDPSDDYAVPFAGGVNEQNLNYQFNVLARAGQIGPGAALRTILTERADPRLATYFPANASGQRSLGEAFNNPTLPQRFVTAQENWLIIAESAYRTGDPAQALTALQTAQRLGGVTESPAGLAGPALLREILTEKYVALFPSIEPWNDYKRTCFPNLAPTATNGRKIPARLLYDAAERNTNTSIPQPQDQPARNPNDPPNATDPFGNVCLGQ